MKKFLTMLLAVAASLFLRVSAQETPDFAVKAMYVDFRTEVHTLQSLKRLAYKDAAAGMNAIVMEYEATFPFDRHATLKNQYAFSQEEIRDFVSYCTELGIEVIPLQNCMGHAQYILRHERYAGLREDAKDMSQVCPLKIDEACEVFREVFAEVAALHPGRYFHIGCDETFLLGRCPECRAYADEHGKSKLFVEYVKAMCELVRELGKVPVIWADIILRHPENLAELPEDLIFVDWNYGWDVNRFGDISGLIASGARIWGATALRSGPDDLYLTQWKKHFDNLSVFVPFARKSGYGGMIQTSWSTSGAYSYRYGAKNEILQMFPIRSVYPMTGFNILIEATSWAFSHEEPLDPETFVHGYAKTRLGLDDDGAAVLWDYFCMPQEQLSDSGGTDVKGRPIEDILGECYAIRSRLAGLRPRRNRVEIDHLRLMLDIRINYLEYKQCEAIYESPAFDDACRPGLKSRLETICRQGRRIDRRLRQLNRGSLQPGEIDYLVSLRGDRMNSLLRTLRQRRTSD